MENPERKTIRLKDYDYAQNGAYFITICTLNRISILSEIVGADDPVRPNTIHLTQIGDIVADCWNSINKIYTNVRTDKHVIMPNHFHGIILINDNKSLAADNSRGGQSRPPLQKVVQGFKSVTTRRCFALGYSTIWQRSFYEHIIRNESEYLQIWNYIDGNLTEWSKDEYYI